MKIDSEYTDLFLLLDKMCLRLKRWRTIVIRTYNDYDYCISVGSCYVDLECGSISIAGEKVECKKNTAKYDGVWDVCIWFSGIGVFNLNNDARLLDLEGLAEDYGYTISNVDVENNKLYLEVMDRVVIGDSSYDDCKLFCDMHDLDYLEMCRQAKKMGTSTLLLARKFYSENSKSTESDAVKRVGAFHG